MNDKPKRSVFKLREHIANIAAILSLIVAVLFLFPFNNFPVAAIFGIIGFASMLAFMGNDALRATGVRRRFFFGYFGLYASLIAIIINLVTLQLDSPLRWTIFLLPVFTGIASSILITLNRDQAMRQWSVELEQQSQSPYLDTAKAEPFYAEQVKDDKVKEQR